MKNYGIINSETGLIAETRTFGPFVVEDLPDDYVKDGFETVDDLSLDAKSGGTWDKETKVYTPKT